MYHNEPLLTYKERKQQEEEGVKRIVSQVLIQSSLHESISLIGIDS